jgi:hypothetical protein
MHRKMSIALAASLLLTVVGSATPAGAAGPGFCHDYAQAALRQVRGAHEHRRCEFRTENQNPARWSTEYRTHYDWCLGASREDADRERDARRETLEHCARD